jgi:glucosamine--fructose-6-phosphate aminotransferase (isomerizing)
MNLTDEKYNRYALVREMMETPEIIRNFKSSDVQRFLKKIKSKKGLLLTGEGSSRIFPAKRAITALRRAGSFFPVITEGSTQAEEYPLNDYAVFAASRPRRLYALFILLKKEITMLFSALRQTPEQNLRSLQKKPMCYRAARKKQ